MRAFPPALVILAYTGLAVVILADEGMPAVKVMLAAVTSASAGLCWAATMRPGRPRLGWATIATGFTGYALGFVVLFFAPGLQSDGVFGLNLSDTLSLPLYPCVYLGLVLLIRSRVRRLSPAAVLDGAVLGLAGSTLALDYVGRTHPLLLTGKVVAAISTLAYPLGSATVLVATLSALPIIGWKFDRTWRLLVAAFMLMTIGDGVYGVQSAAHDFRFGTPVDLMYTAGPVLVSMAAWFGSGPAELPAQATTSVGFAAPGVATLTAVGMLASDHFHPIPAIAVAFAAAAASLAVGRTAIFIRQEKHLARSREEARTDALTGLGNRRALLQQVQSGIDGELPIALALVDLDGFKAVNDALGHAAGDVLLIDIAKRLNRLPAEVSRLGGDEFAVVMNGSLAEGMCLATSIRLAIAPSIVVEGSTIGVTASVGLALGGPGQQVKTAGELLRRADVALYRAKELRTGVEPWHSELDAGSRQRLQLANELRAALGRADEIEAWLQPKVDAHTMRVLGYEALVRWRHPSRGLLSPGEFLDAAERAGLVPQITRLVLEQALGCVQRLRAAGELVTVAVNVCAGDLMDRDFPELVANLLSTYRLPPSALQLEITETVVMSDPTRILATMKILRSLGIGLSLDDYGTGLSSLAHLRTLPVTELKIDRSFVMHLVHEPASALIVQSTINLAHGLGLHVTAEGVEDADTLHALADLGCDLIQGYFTGRPAPGPSYLAPRERQAPFVGAGAPHLAGRTT